jgi:hypothetical protein
MDSMDSMGSMGNMDSMGNMVGMDNMDGMGSGRRWRGLCSVYFPVKIFPGLHEVYYFSAVKASIRSI